MNLVRKAWCMCIIIVSFAGTTAADVLVDFETTTFPNSQDHQYGAIFNGLSVIGGFPSYAVSSRTTPSSATFSGAYFFNGDDSVVASAGATGSPKWLAAYNYSAGDVVFSAASGSIISKVEVNNTALVDFTLRNGLGGFSNALLNNGDYFRVRFIGFNNLLQQTSTTDWLTLASNTSGTLSVLSNWTQIDLSMLNANRIGFEFDGSDKNAAGLLTPTYLAFDNFVITAVPEPSSLGLVAVWNFCLRSSSTKGWRVMSVPSPCTGVCLLSSAKICQGCFRSVGEIAAWSSMSSRQRSEAVENANARRAAAAGIATAVPAAFGQCPTSFARRSRASIAVSVLGHFERALI